MAMLCMSGGIMPTTSLGVRVLLSVGLHFMVLDLSIFSFENKKGGTPPKMFGDRCAVIGRYGYFHFVSLLMYEYKGVGLRVRSLPAPYDFGITTTTNFPQAWARSLPSVATSVASV